MQYLIDAVVILLLGGSLIWLGASADRDIAALKAEKTGLEAELKACKSR